MMPTNAARHHHAIPVFDFLGSGACDAPGATIVGPVLYAEPNVVAVEKGDPEWEHSNP
jgi:hypothetical protein